MRVFRRLDRKGLSALFTGLSVISLISLLPAARTLLVQTGSWFANFVIIVIERHCSSVSFFSDPNMMPEVSAIVVQGITPIWLGAASALGSLIVAVLCSWTRQVLRKRQEKREAAQSMKRYVS